MHARHGLVALIVLFNLNGEGNGQENAKPSLTCSDPLIIHLWQIVMHFTVFTPV